MRRRAQRYRHLDVLVRKYGFRFNKTKHRHHDKTGNRRHQEQARLAHFGSWGEAKGARLCECEDCRWKGNCRGVCWYHRSEDSLGGGGQRGYGGDCIPWQRHSRRRRVSGNPRWYVMDWTNIIIALITLGAFTAIYLLVDLTSGRTSA